MRDKEDTPQREGRPTNSEAMRGSRSCAADRACSRSSWPAAAAARAAAQRQQRTRRGGKKGGTLTILDTAGGVDSLDPGYWYYQSDYQDVCRPPSAAVLVEADDTSKPTPDLADGAAAGLQRRQDADDQDQPGIKYSPPLQTQTVKSADIKYAMERCFLPQVGNGYAGAYYGDIVGARRHARAGKAKEDLGHPDARRHDARHQAHEADGVADGGDALALPCTVAGAEGLRGEVRPGQARRRTASTRCSPART